MVVPLTAARVWAVFGLVVLTVAVSGPSDVVPGTALPLPTGSAVAEDPCAVVDPGNGEVVVYPENCAPP